MNFSSNAFLSINLFLRNCLLGDPPPQVSCNLLSVLLGMSRFQGSDCSLLRPLLRIMFAARNLDRWITSFYGMKNKPSILELGGKGD